MSQIVLTATLPKKHKPYPWFVHRVKYAFGEVFGYAECLTGYAGEDIWFCADRYGDTLVIVWADGIPQSLYDECDLERARGYFCLGLLQEQVEQYSTAHERAEWMREFCEKHPPELWPDAWRQQA